MKKVLAILLVLALLTSLTVLTVSCKNEPENYIVDTYKGAVSNESYETKGDAVNAFLKNELSGETTEPVLLDYSVEKELEDSEIDELEIPTEQKNGLSKVEMVEINYYEIKIETEKPVNIASKGGLSFVRKVLVLVYENGSFRYFTLPIEVGESLTASYINSVFDYNNYKNCTLISNANIKYNMKVEGLTQKGEISLGGDYKVAEEAIYMRQRYSMNGLGLGSSSKQMEIYAWTDENNNFVGAVKKDDYWEVSTLDEFGSFDEFIEYSFDSSFGIYDGTYFQKTADGYELQEGKGKEWYIDYAEKIGLGEIVGALDSIDDFNVKFSVSIRDGKVSRVNISFNFSFSQDGTYVSFTSTGTVVLNDFGSTKVNVPDEAKNAIY